MSAGLPAHTHPVACMSSMDLPLICVVDDDSAVRTSLKFALELEGFRVKTCSDADGALAAEEAQPSDCLLIDYRMPRTNGLELLAKLRARSIDTPVILMISDPTPAIYQAARKAGVLVIEKPLLGDTLSDGIRAALGTSFPGGLR
jgi:FixJ family two-component response regulator